MSSIVVVGGGFAGLNAALAAARVAEERRAVVLVSRDRFLTIRPRLYERNPQALRVDLQEPLAAAGVQFVEGEAVGVDAMGLALASGATVAFARLVVATGSTMRRPDVPGAEAPYSIDDYAAALAFDRRLAELGDQPAPTIAVVGAGFTGIELALELRDRIAVHAGPAAGERAKILLVDRADCVGSELGPGPRPVIEEALAAARIERKLSARIIGLGRDFIALADGTPVVADAVVLCTGLRAAPFVATIPGAKDRSGRLVTDAFLRAPESEKIFAAGDAACASPEPGRETLLSCQHALTLGKFAGENAARDALGLPLVPYRQPRYVTCLALGRSGAVYSEGFERVPRATGAEAKAIKVRINTQRIYPPRGSRTEILAASALP